MKCELGDLKIEKKKLKKESFIQFESSVWIACYFKTCNFVDIRKVNEKNTRKKT